VEDAAKKAESESGAGSPASEKDKDIVVVDAADAEGSANGKPPPPPLPVPADGGDHDATVDGVVDKMVESEKGAVEVEGVEVNIEAHVKTSPTSEDEDGAGNAANTVTVAQQ